MRYWILLAVFLCTSLALAQTQVANGPEYDPPGMNENDLYPLANVIPVGSPSVWIIGDVEAGVDNEDYFTFFAFSGDLLTMSFTGDVLISMENPDHSAMTSPIPDNFVATTTGYQFLVVTPVPPVGVTPYYWVLSNHTNDTLPVELTSFAAAFNTGSGAVQLSWETASETDLLGYCIYRNTENSPETAQNMNVTIEAVNTATGATYQYTDSDVYGNTTYYYWLQSVEMTGYTMLHGPVMVTTGTGNPGNGTPDPTFTDRLLPCYPNPFNPSTTVQYTVADDGTRISMAIYDLRGARVRDLFNGMVDKGSHSVVWDGYSNAGTQCASGVYFVRTHIGQNQFIGKMSLVK